VGVVEDANPHSRHDRSVIAAAVLATLLVVAGPRLADEWGGRLSGTLVPETPLTEAAQRVLAEMPEAFQAGGLVVVPAASDPYVAWVQPVAEDRVVGDVVALDVHGLAGYGYLPAAGGTPTWLDAVTPADGVHSDVGPLSFACTSWPGTKRCTGTLLTEHAGRRHIFRAGLGSPESPDPVIGLRGFGAGGMLDVYVGWMPPGASTVWATVVGDQYVRDVPGRSSRPGAVGGQTVWWLRSEEPVSAVSFLDPDGEVVERVTVGR
jgi:hypothetical protein